MSIAPTHTHYAASLALIFSFMQWSEDIAALCFMVARLKIIFPSFCHSLTLTLFQLYESKVYHVLVVGFY